MGRCSYWVHSSLTPSNSKARCCRAVGHVSISNGLASSSFGWIRLRVIVAKSSSSARKLCAVRPSVASKLSPAPPAKAAPGPPASPVAPRPLPDPRRRTAAAPTSRACATPRSRPGLTLTAHRITRQYARGVRISDAQMDALELLPEAARPRWNYEIRPHATAAPAPLSGGGSDAPADNPTKPAPAAR